MGHRFLELVKLIFMVLDSQTIFSPLCVRFWFRLSLLSASKTALAAIDVIEQLLVHAPPSVTVLPYHLKITNPSNTESLLA